MRSIDIREAKKHLLRLVEQAAGDEPFIITRDGKPLVKVVPLAGEMRRLGFLAGEIAVPDDFDTMGAAGIEEAFSGRE